MRDETFLSREEEKLLLKILFNQQYALDVVSCELTDIERGDKQVQEEDYKQIINLYHRLRVKDL